MTIVRSIADIGLILDRGVLRVDGKIARIQRMERDYVAVVHCIEPARRASGQRVGEKLSTVLRIALTPSGDPTVMKIGTFQPRRWPSRRGRLYAQRSVGSFTGSVPTELERRGDFSQTACRMEI